MAYTDPVKFTAVNTYGCHPHDENDVYTVASFKELCECGAFVDYDGHGYPVKGRLADTSIVIRPSRLSAIPADATHIVWYNR